METYVSRYAKLQRHFYLPLGRVLGIFSFAATLVRHPKRGQERNFLSSRRCSEAKFFQKAASLQSDLKLHPPSRGGGLAGGRDPHGPPASPLLVYGNARRNGHGRHEGGEQRKKELAAKMETKGAIERIRANRRIHFSLFLS